METLYSICAGLDVHKTTVVACLRRRDVKGKVRQQTRTFGTTTAALLDLSDWLSTSGVTHVAMESTGVYWKPIWNLLEGQFQILLVNAQHIKQVPGRKTDVKDAEWIAQLLQHGLLRGSFVPPTPQREMRELTRQRRKLIQANAAVANRIHKILEDANIKLGSVATDVLGVSGRAMLEAIIAGETEPARLAEHARGRMRRKLPELVQALRGRVTDHHRFLLRLLLDDLMARERLIARVSERIRAVMPAPMTEAIQRLVTIPGIDERAAQSIVAETGPDLAPFAGACAVGVLGRRLFGQQRECREAEERQDDQGEPLAPRDSGAERLGGESHEADVPVGAVPETGWPPGEEASVGGVGAHVVGGDLSVTQAADDLPRTRCGLLRSTGCGPTGPQPGPAFGETGAQGDPRASTGDLMRTE